MIKQLQSDHWQLGELLKAARSDIRAAREAREGARQSPQSPPPNQSPHALAESTPRRVGGDSEGTSRAVELLRVRDETIAGLNSQVSKLKRSLENAEEEIDSWTRKFSELERNLIAVEASQSDLDALKAKLAAKEAECRTKDAECHSLLARFETLVNETSQVRADSDRIQRKAAECDLYAAKYASEAKQCKRLVVALRQKEEALKSCQVELMMRTLHDEEQKDRLAALEKARDELQARMRTETEAHNAALEEAYGELQDTAYHLGQARIDLEESRRALKAANAAALQAIQGQELAKAKAKRRKSHRHSQAHWLSDSTGSDSALPSSSDSTSALQARGSEQSSSRWDTGADWSKRGSKDRHSDRGRASSSRGRREESDRERHRDMDDRDRRKDKESGSKRASSSSAWDRSRHRDSTTDHGKDRRDEDYGAKGGRRDRDAPKGRSGLKHLDDCMGVLEQQLLDTLLQQESRRSSRHSSRQTSPRSNSDDDHDRESGRAWDGGRRWGKGQTGVEVGGRHQDLERDLEETRQLLLGSDGALRVGMLDLPKSPAPEEGEGTVRRARDDGR